MDRVGKDRLQHMAPDHRHLRTQVTVEVRSPASGTLTAILSQKEDTLIVGEDLLEIDVLMPMPASTKHAPHEVHAISTSSFQPVQVGVGSQSAAATSPAAVPAVPTPAASPPHIERGAIGVRFHPSGKPSLIRCSSALKPPSRSHSPPRSMESFSHRGRSGRFSCRCPCGCSCRLPWHSAHCARTLTSAENMHTVLANHQRLCPCVSPFSYVTLSPNGATLARCWSFRRFRTAAIEAPATSLPSPTLAATPAAAALPSKPTPAANPSPLANVGVRVDEAPPRLQMSAEEMECVESGGAISV